MYKINLVFVISRGDKNIREANLGKIKQFLAKHPEERILVVYGKGDLKSQDLFKAAELNTKKQIILFEEKPIPHKQPNEQKEGFLREIENHALRKGCTAVMFLVGNTEAASILSGLSLWTEKGFATVEAYIPSKPGDAIVIQNRVWEKV